MFGLVQFIHSRTYLISNPSNLRIHIWRYVIRKFLIGMTHRKVLFCIFWVEHTWFRSIELTCIPGSFAGLSWVHTGLFCRALLNVYRALLQGSFECIQGSFAGLFWMYTGLFCRALLNVYRAYVENTWVGIHIWRCLIRMCFSYLIFFE